MEFDQNQKETSIVKVLEVDCLNDNIKTEFDNRIKVENNFHHIYYDHYEKFDGKYKTFNYIDYYEAKDKIGELFEVKDYNKKKYFISIYNFNFNKCYSNLWVINYPIGGCGSIISTCLGMSDKFLDFISREEKIEYTENILKLSLNEKQWYDLDLSYPNHYLISNDKPGIFVVHNKNSLFQYHDKITGLRTINVVNYQLLIMFRYFPKNIGISTKEFFRESTDNKIKLLKNFYDKNYNYKKFIRGETFFTASYFDINTDLKFDLNAIFSLDTFLNEIGRLYSEMDLTGFNSDSIAHIYTMWLNTLDNFNDL